MREILDYQVSDSRNRISSFSREWFGRSIKTINLELDGRIEPFFENGKLQILGISILIPVLGMSSMWKSHNDVFQQLQFRTEVTFYRLQRNLDCEKNYIISYEKVQ